MCLCVSVLVHVLYLLLGWVEVFRSGLKEHSDLLALGDVDWQLNEGLQAQKIAGNLGKSHTLTSTITSLHTEVNQRLNIVFTGCLVSKNKQLLHAVFKSIFILLCRE